MQNKRTVFKILGKRLIIQEKIRFCLRYQSILFQHILNYVLLIITYYELCLKLKKQQLLSSSNRLKKLTINYTSTTSYSLIIYQILFALYSIKYYYTILMIGLKYKTSANFSTQENYVSLKACKEVKYKLCLKFKLKYSMNSVILQKKNFSQQCWCIFVQLYNKNICFIVIINFSLIFVVT